MLLLEGFFSISTCRLEVFSGTLGRYRHAQHLEQMSVADIEVVVNVAVPSAPFTRAEIMSLLEVSFHYSVQFLAQHMAFKGTIDTQIVYFLNFRINILFYKFFI